MQAVHEPPKKVLAPQRPRVTRLASKQSIATRNTPVPPAASTDEACHLTALVALSSYTARNIMAGSFLGDGPAPCSWLAVPLLRIALRKPSHVSAKSHAQGRTPRQYL